MAAAQLQMYLWAGPAVLAANILFGGPARRDHADVLSPKERLRHGDPLTQNRLLGRPGRFNARTIPKYFSIRPELVGRVSKYDGS